MTKDHAVDIALLHLRDAHEFAPLLASYAQALKRGAPRRPDDFYAEHLLQDRAAEALGARVDGNLVALSSSMICLNPSLACAPGR